jgi:phosphoglycolate/pyridoxal phosphate phosphatase family enzyme
VKKAYVMGANGLMEELNSVGIECLGREDDHAVFPDLHALDTVTLEEGVGAVVVGSDLQCNMVKYSKAHMYLTCYDQPCLFLATNMDASNPLSNGRQGPGTGAMVSFLSVGTHRQPTVVGKPSDFLVEYFLENFEINPSTTVMVGDRLETDMAFGNKLGADTLLVLTGASSQEQVDATEDPLMVPKFIFPSLKELYEAVQN